MGVKNVVGKALAPKISGLAPGLTTTFVREALHRAITGVGPLAGAAAAAEKQLKEQRGDVDKAVHEVIEFHVRLAGAQGFVTNIGGLVTAALTIPTNITGLALIQCRMIAGIAHLRGYDLADPRVRNAILATLMGDDTVGANLAEQAGLAGIAHDWILEGGAIDVDGSGLAVTTEQCLLHPNRNPGLDRAEVEERLRANLGLERILWLGDGLANDHTDGHVDNLARFVAEGRLAIPVAAGPDDPNAAVYADARARAEAAGLEVVLLPSTGRVERHGEIVPASYMNFYIGNAAVVVPQYGAANDAAAVQAVGALFPGRKTVGLRADHILTGGGSFHCISQQVPV